MLNLLVDWFPDGLNVGVGDVVDILIASVLVYCVIRLFQITHSKAPMTGGVVLLLLYFAARAFGLFLTEMLLRGAAFILVVVFAIAFHEDIRRTVARFRGWRGRRKDGAQRGLDQLDPIIEFAFEGAASRIGALIVLCGRDSLEDMLHGGIELTAPVHSILFQSIFDPHSPGHDGAVVISGGFIRRMCAHLPLSSDHLTLGDRGTRHSAGLGLSERSDALAIIVSEEHGAVSVARSGRLISIDTPVQLKELLQDFIDQRFPSPRVAKHPGRYFRRMGWKFASVCLATLGWLAFVSHPDDVERTFVVPVEYRNVPEKLRVDAAPTEARLTLRGSEPAFALLAPGSLKVSVSIEQRSAGPVELYLSEDNCVHPKSLDVYGVEPRVLRFRLVERNPKPTAGRQ